MKPSTKPLYSPAELAFDGGRLSLANPASAPSTIRDVEFIEMPVRQILNRCDKPAMHFRWTINPYRGCEFGCVYCYARYTHEFLELRDPMDFERRIFVKRMAAEVLARTLARTPLGADQIAIGTATDPYQPAERKFGLTRRCSRCSRRLGGLDLSITTKSALIVRDLDLLARDQLAIAPLGQFLADYDQSPPAADARAARAAAGAAPAGTVAQLTAAGIRCNVLMMPMIPGLTDDPLRLRA